MTDAPGEPAPPRFGEFAADALRYWEPRRLLYNAALFAVVATHFLIGWPGTRQFLTWDHLFMFFVLAVLANVAYCAAYAVDLFVQYSTLRPVWGRLRWTLLAVGTAFGAILAHFFAKGLLAYP